ncbi:hypothetical protein BKA70DRAFT_1408869 [Coprinopsis sp. MPI-PUGE-AT-0042]|nr:hypothetical protein BKA70DRAFT_1408869 [Coprinopsis sp. MPI-PUGE-AT-0042]
MVATTTTTTTPTMTTTFLLRRSSQNRTPTNYRPYLYPPWEETRMIWVAYWDDSHLDYRIGYRRGLVDLSFVLGGLLVIGNSGLFTVIIPAYRGFPGRIVLYTCRTWYCLALIYVTWHKLVLDSGFVRWLNTFCPRPDFVLTATTRHKRFVRRASNQDSSVDRSSLIEAT